LASPAPDPATDAPPLTEPGEPTALLQTQVERVAALAQGAAIALFRDRDGARLDVCGAAGFPDADYAQGFAARVLDLAERALERAEPCASGPVDDLGPRGAGGVLVFPLRGQRAYGALAVACARKPNGVLREVIAMAADASAAQLDRRELHTALREQGRAAVAKSDEVLKLSETLFAQDIELLRNNERLGQIERLKNDFIEKMSRELRTPLNSIIESIIAVLAGENDVLSESARQSLRRALDDGTAFLRTLQNILDLWRIKQGELPVELQEVNFREVVEEAIFSVQDTLAGKPVHIEKNFTEPLPKIRTDLTKVNQVLFLLLDNAAKFTQQGRIEIRSRVEGSELVCEIEDSGIGICADDQQFVFDEFFQVDDPASTKYRGAGLGLALVRDLVTLLDGSLSMTSDVGRGSTVGFRLPVEMVG